MILLGAILAILGYLLGVGLLMWLGVALLVVGAVLWVAGSTGHPVGGRPHYW